MSLEIINTYKRKNDGRWIAYCVDDLGKSHTISYPRVLMENELGRPLKPDEDVHHIDGNIDNNDISNLEIKKHGEHQREHSTKYIDTIEKCIICGSLFNMSGNEWARLYVDLHRKPPKKRLLTCCKSCAGKASSGTYQYLYNMEDRLQEVKSLWKK